MTADSPETLVQLDGVEVARPFVEHVARDCREARPVVRVARSADGQQRQETDERHRVVLDGHHPQAVGKLPPANVGEFELGLRAE